MTNTTNNTQAKGPKPVLRTDRLYFAGDHTLCHHCAGTTALHTGRDLYGRELTIVTNGDTTDFQHLAGYPLTCDCGTYRAEISTPDDCPNIAATAART